MANTDLINLGLLGAFHDELRKGMEAGDVEINATDMADWNSVSTLIPYTHQNTADTSGGDISIRSDVQARLDSIVPTSEKFKATKLVATGVNLLRLNTLTGGIATALSSGVYFPCPALAFGTYGTAQENNGLLFTNEGTATNQTWLQPTVYMKDMSLGVPTSLTDGVAATVITGTNGEKFYVNPSSLAGKPVYVIVSGITQASSCAHIAWSGTGIGYDYYVSPTATADAGTDADLTAALTAVGNDGYLTVCGQKHDDITCESDTLLRWTKRNGRVQPTWDTAEDESNEGTYTHTATIDGMESGGTAMLETSGTLLTGSGTTVSYSDSSATATTDYVLYNLASETTGTSAATMRATIQDFGLVVLLGAEGTANLTIAYAQTVKDLARQFFMGGKDDDHKVITEALNALYADNQRQQAYILELEKRTQPLTSTTAGAPSSSVTPEGWDADRYGAWKGTPAWLGQEYIDKASKKLYKAMTLTGQVSDWVVMN